MIREAPCWALGALVIALAWPIWLYQKEYALFARRAVLAGVTPEGSRLRRWFWAGRFVGAWHVVVAILWAVALAVLANLLNGWQWIVLAADAVLLGFLIAPITRRLAGDVRAEQLGLVARHWPLALINMAVLALAFATIDFLSGAPDTRGLAWHVVAEQSFAKGSAGAACPLAGWMVGAATAADALTWHAAEVLIPSLPHQGLKLVAWMLVLLQAGVVAYAVTRLYLGVAAALDRTQPTSSRDFFATAGVVAVVLLLLTFALRGMDTAWLSTRAHAALAWANPCRSDNETLTTLKAKLESELQKARVEEQQRATQRIEGAVNALYADVEGGVDRYLDWYFTVIGEYQRLGALVTGRFAEQMKTELESRIFGDAFGERLERASAVLEAESHDRLVALGAELGAQVESGAAAHPCWTDTLNVAALGDLQRDKLRASTSVAGGVAAGLLTARALARRAAAGAAAKASSKRVFQAGASVAGRIATKRAGGTLVAAAGGAAVCGPFAPLCALVAAGVTWIALDKAFIEIDELAFRDEMRAEILAAVAQQRAELVEALALQHHARIDRTLSAIDGSVRRVFVPARDGV